MSIQKKPLPQTNGEAINQKQFAHPWVKLPMLLLIVAIGIVLLVTTALADSPTEATDHDHPTPIGTLPAQTIYLGPRSGGEIDDDRSGTGHDVHFSDEDILVCTPVVASCVWGVYFDGSDVALSKVNVEDFEILPNGHILFTIDRTYTIGHGFNEKVTPRDVIEFTPTSTGPNTEGTFSFYLLGNSVGLDKSGENIDALAMTPGGQLVVSLTGSGSVPKTGGGKLSVKDEDLIQLDGATWSPYLDGSSFKLTSSSEDVAASWIDPSSVDKDVYVTTKGSFSAKSINSFSGKNTDILGIAPTSFNPIASGFLFRFFDAKSNGLTKGIDGLFALPATSAQAQQAAVTSAAVDNGTADDTADEAPDMSEADPDDSELDAYDYMDVQSIIYLPLVNTQ